MLEQSQYTQQQQFEVRPSGQHFSVDVALAAHYGLEEAFIIHHFQHWIRLNKTKNQNFKDGSFWTYQTMEDIAAHFPFLSRRQVKYTIQKLVNKKVLKIANYNKCAMDKTNWYAFVREDIFVPDIPINSKNAYERQNCPSMDKIVHREDNFVQAIPDTKPDTKPRSLKDNVFCKSKIEDNEKEKSKYPLKKDQIPIFEEMKALDLGCTDEILKIIIRQQTKLNKLDFLKECIHHLRVKIESGFKFKKEKIAFLRNCLAGKQSIITNNCIENKKIAEEFCKMMQWHGVKITDKFIEATDGNISKEIPTMLPKNEFERMLGHMYRFFNPLEE
jgi:hypothetical protein